MNTTTVLKDVFSFFTSHPLILLIIILGLFALYIIIRLRHSFSGPLRYGRVVSADHTNWRRGENIYSHQHNLAGKPDYVIKTNNGGLIPVEIKSTPWRGRVYDSHKMQVASYCLLLEEKYGAAPRYGVIEYGDGKTVKIPYTPALKQQLIDTMREMRSLTLPPDWQPDSRRCRGCSMRGACDRVTG